MPALKAPKDPVDKRPSFYIMHDKEVSAGPQPDGRGVSFNYLDGGRIIGHSKIVGNVTDDEILKLIPTAEGFKKLVHTIGVSVSSSDPNQTISFVFQMYGRTDTYGGGTSIVCDVPGDGSEVLIPLSEIEWKTDDHVVGQIRFEFSKPQLAEVSVRLYLNDGFNAPLAEPDFPVDFNSAAYKAMIEKSFISLGNPGRLQKALKKAQDGNEITVAFIGGSITQGAGATPINTKCYPYLITEHIREITGAGDRVHYIKAGVGGTPSELGMLRYEEDILKEGTPDIVFIEFAVNDAGDETNGLCYESLIRNIMNGPGNPAVVLVFAVFADGFNLEERLVPVGEYYNLPMFSVKRAVFDEFLKKASDGRAISRYQYFYDPLHPNNTGHRVMADCAANLLKAAADAPLEVPVGELPSPLLGVPFDDLKVLRFNDIPSDAVIDEGDFSATDPATQYVERNLDMQGTPQFPFNKMHVEGGSKPFVMKMQFKDMLIIYLDSADASVGTADVFVDGKYVRSINPHEVGWTHVNPYIIYRGETTAMHEVKVQMAEGQENLRFTICGFGYTK